MHLLHRLTTELSHKTWACELALALTAAERKVLTATRGRHSLSSALGVRLCLVWTRGARTRRWRSAPVICTRHDGGLLVLGSHGGRPTHPQWTNNLLRDSTAALTLGGTTTPARARLLTGSERAALWPKALGTWPPYETYERRSGRQLRMFLLSPE